MTKPKLSKYIKGPLKAAVIVDLITNCPPSALHAYLVIHFVKGLRNSSKIQLKYSQAGELGVEPRSLWNGLTILQERGIIAVIRKRGVKPYVELL